MAKALYDAGARCTEREIGSLGSLYTDLPLNFEQLPRQPVEEAEEVGEQQEESRLPDREIFQELAHTQSRKLHQKILSVAAKPSKQSLIGGMLEGVIPMIGWKKQWIPIHAKNEELTKALQENEVTTIAKKQRAEELKRDLSLIQQELGQLKKENDTMKAELEIVEFYDQYLGSIASVEEELSSSFEVKIKNGEVKEFSVDEVSLFLNVAEIGELLAHQRENKFDGEDLASSMSDISTMAIKNILLEKSLQLQLKVLEYGLFLKKDVLEKSVVWRHRDIEKTLVLLKEWGVALDGEIVKKKQISISQLIFFKNKDLVELFKITPKEARPIATTLQTLRKGFIKFLKENRAS